MKLTIISSQDKKILSIAWLEVNSHVGNFVIQRGHAPMVVTIDPHKPFIFCLSSGKQETLYPKGGLLEVNRTSALLLLSE